MQQSREAGAAELSRVEELRRSDPAAFSMLVLELLKVAKPGGWKACE